jgi:hypothetical protein
MALGRDDFRRDGARTSERKMAMSSIDQLLVAAWTGAVQGAITCAAPVARERPIDSGDDGIARDLPRADCEPSDPPSSRRAD